MSKAAFSVDYLKEELMLPYEEEYVMEDVIVDQGRWSTHHKLIFFDPETKKYWKTWYSEGSTEMQPERPWEYEAVVECEEVRKEMVWVSKFVPVDEEKSYFRNPTKEEVAAVERYLRNIEYDTGVNFYEILDMRFGDDGR